METEVVAVCRMSCLLFAARFVMSLLGKDLVG